MVESREDGLLIPPTNAPHATGLLAYLPTADVLETTGLALVRCTSDPSSWGH